MLKHSQTFFLPLSPSFLPFPLASFTSLTSLCLVGFLRYIHSSHLTPPLLPLFPSSPPRSNQFLEPHRKCTICTAFVLTIPLAYLLPTSTCPRQKCCYLSLLAAWLLEKQGFSIFILYFKLTILSKCCYYHLLTSRAYLDLLGFVFTPLFEGGGRITQLVGS